MRPLILISNDDGVFAKGINCLIEMLRPLGDLFVVAPKMERSGASCSITTPMPITAHRLRIEDGLTVYSCSGTPTDCVKLALDQLLLRKPDLVVSGINHGTNEGINAHYSGTVGGAMEGVLHGIPSIAYSLLNTDHDANFEPMAYYVQHLTKLVLENGLPKWTLLNVNFPDVEEYAGVRVCRMSYNHWENEYAAVERPRGGRYFWLGGDIVNDCSQDETTDSWALAHDYVAIAPLQIDATDYDTLAVMSDWNL